MRILILGGTAWLSHLIGTTAHAAGHDVTCLARGSAVPPGTHSVRADRDRDDALSAVSGTRWDVVVDVAQHPGHVRRAVRDLEASSARYLYISSISAYASLRTPGQTEDAPLADPLESEKMASLDDFSAAKSACESAVMSGFGPDRSTILRPGLIGGPGDPTGRTLYWPMRFARPSSPEGAVLVPDEPEQPTSVIDVRDLASWVIRLAEDAVSGVFHATGDSIPLGEHLAIARSVSDAATTLAPAASSWLLDQGVAQWAGPRSLPLWLVAEGTEGMNALSPAASRAAGLAPRPLESTLADALAWAERERLPLATGSGLTDAQERELLGLLRASLS